MDSYDSYNTAQSDYKHQKSNYNSYYASNFRTEGVAPENSEDNSNMKVCFI